MGPGPLPTQAISPVLSLNIGGERSIGIELSIAESKKYFEPSWLLAMGGVGLFGGPLPPPTETISCVLSFITWAASVPSVSTYRLLKVKKKNLGPRGSERRIHY